MSKFIPIIVPGKGRIPTLGTLGPKLVPFNVNLRALSAIVRAPHSPGAVFVDPDNGEQVVLNYSNYRRVFEEFNARKNKTTAKTPEVKGTPVTKTVKEEPKKEEPKVVVPEPEVTTPEEVGEVSETVETDVAEEVTVDTVGEATEEAPLEQETTETETAAETETDVVQPVQKQYNNNHKRNKHR
jgi:hypothetical protein